MKTTTTEWYHRAWRWVGRTWWDLRWPVLIVVVSVILLVGCGGDAKADPYDTYLENAPESEPILSREDAQIRAMLGCSQEAAPGTVDGVLQDAYGCP